MTKKDPNRNMSRIQIKSTRGGFFSGWEVRIQRRGKQVHKFFNDKKFGGAKGAQAAAREFRDAVESRMKPYTVVDRSKTPSTRNKSGIVGVRRHHQVDMRGEFEYHYHYWVAQWTDADGKRKTKSFSIEELGEDKAFKLAVAARREGIKAAGR
jgi:hypothetical protein